MIESNVLLAFFTTSVILALSPGPDNLFVLAQSAQNGRMAGWFVTLGLATGLIGHTIAVAFGLAAIVHSSALAFSILKYMGAAYLLYLAWQAFRAAALTGQQEPVQVLSKRKSLPARDCHEPDKSQGFSLFYGFSATVC